MYNIALLFYLCVQRVACSRDSMVDLKLHNTGKRRTVVLLRLFVSSKIDRYIWCFIASLPRRVISGRSQMWPTLTKGGQSRWEDHEINWRKHHIGVISSMYCFSCIHIVFVGRLFYHVRTAHIPFWPIHDMKTHFKLQTPTVTHRGTVSVKSLLGCVFLQWTDNPTVNAKWYEGKQFLRPR